MNKTLATLFALVLSCAPRLDAQPIAGRDHVHEDCHGSAAVYLAAKPFIINPAVAERAKTLILAIVDDPSLHVDARVPFRIEVRDSSGRPVFSESGIARMLPGRSTELGFTWDGIDGDGEPVPDGEYEIDLIAQVHRRGSRAWLQGAGADADRLLADGERAPGSTLQVVVDRAGRYDALFAVDAPPRAGEDRSASLDGSFPYRFFFGSTHAHTAWSDGGMPVNNCASGRYGVAGGAQPSDAWTYARTVAGLHFLAVVEHNHLMQEACAGCSEQTVRDRYRAGFNGAVAATVVNQFVALFGMEWGVISGGGHINIYNQPNLMAWSGEPHHVLTPRSDYPALYRALRNHQPLHGSFGTFNHPSSTDFGNFVRTADGDAVMRGLAVVSGPAFSTSTAFTPGGTRYEARYQQALSYGWRIAPEAQQDNHCWNFGNSTPNRTVALIPNGTPFDQASLMAAIGARRFYASEDRNAQLIFRTTNGSSVMGASFNTPNPSIHVTARVLDPDGEGVFRIQILGGRTGTHTAPGPAPTVVASNSGQNTLSVSLPRPGSGQRWYYYVRAVQADGDVLWSAPIWIFWQ